jgi:hypothetical protein
LPARYGFGWCMAIMPPQPSRLDTHRRAGAKSRVAPIDPSAEADIHD